MIQMAIYITLAVFLFASSVTCNPVCMVCDGVPSTMSCNQVKTCGPHEQCFIDAFIEPQWGHLYNLGCRDSLQCAAHDRQQRLANMTCSACCQGDLCSAHDCGQRGWFYEHGPICFSCRDMVNETDCGTIEECHQGQVPTGGPLESGCSWPDHCSSLAAKMSAIAIGKRSIPKDPICHVQCCSSDLCNTRCSNSTSITGSTTQIPSLSSSTSPYIVSTHDPFPTDLDPCLANPCMRGRCVSQGHGYNCVCDAGYTGLHCEHVLTIGSSQGACSSKPCVQGSCEPHGFSYVCHCHSGYWGRDCELAPRSDSLRA